MNYPDSILNGDFYVCTYMFGTCLWLSRDKAWVSDEDLAFPWSLGSCMALVLEKGTGSSLVVPAEIYNQMTFKETRKELLEWIAQLKTL